MEIKNVNYGRISDYLKKYPKAKYIAGKRPWEVKCDIALPCATQNELNEEEANTLVKKRLYLRCRRRKHAFNS